MATIEYTSTDDTGSQDGSVIIYTWPLIATANPNGAPIRATQFADRYFTVKASVWGAATLTIEGSNDGTNFWPLSNAAGGTAATFTADGGKSIIELPLWIRPNLTVVGTAASMTVVLVARRANPMRT